MCWRERCGRKQGYIERNCKVEEKDNMVASDIMTYFIFRVGVGIGEDISLIHANGLSLIVGIHAQINHNPNKNLKPMLWSCLPSRNSKKRATYCPLSSLLSSTLPLSFSIKSTWACKKAGIEEPSKDSKLIKHRPHIHISIRAFRTISQFST